MVTSPPFTLDPMGSDIPGEAAQLRGIGDVVRVELPGGIPAWAITRHDLLRQVILDPQVSKDPSQHWRLWPEVATRPEWSWIQVVIGGQTMLNAYGADHRRLRKLLAPSFTNHRTKALQPIIESITAELLDELSALPAGESVELREAYAHPLPLGVICELFGVPCESRLDFARLVETILDLSNEPSDVIAAFGKVNSMIRDLISLKREYPADDLTTDLVNSRDRGDRLTDDELVDTLLMIISGGQETTVSLILSAVHALCTHPDQLEQVQAGIISWEAVVEETLRWSPPAANIPMRFAIETLNVGDVEIPAGDAILTTYLAAGRDPRHHGPRADQFDAARPASERREHLAFGIGAHHCIGEPLAWQEALTALPALFNRFPDLRLAVDTSQLRQNPSFLLQGWSRLPVQLAETAADQVTVHSDPLPVSMKAAAEEMNEWSTW